MKAWLCTCVGVSGVVFAETRAKARYTTIQSASEVGYTHNFLEPCSVIRAPQYDCLNLESRRGWTIEYADSELARRGGERYREDQCSGKQPPKITVLTGPLLPTGYKFGPEESARSLYGAHWPDWTVRRVIKDGGVP